MPKSTAPTEKSRVTNQSAAEALDAQINQKIADCTGKLVRAYLDLAISLKQMRDTAGYKHLQFTSWEEYLESKREFGRTYLSYLYKLGQVEDLHQYADKGLSASQLIECAKVASRNEIAGLLATTVEAIKGKTVKQTREILREHVAAKKLQRVSTASLEKRGRKPDPWKKKFQNQFQALSRQEQSKFLMDMRDFLSEYDNANQNEIPTNTVINDGLEALEVSKSVPKAVTP